MEDFKGTTIDLERFRYDDQGEKLLTSKQARALLQVRSRTTWLKYKAAVNLPERGVFREADLIELLKVRLFLASPEKKFTYELFQSESKHLAMLSLRWKQRGINFDLESQKLRAAIALSPGWKPLG